MPTFEPWWELTSCLVELMVPVAQLMTAIQADHANLADVHYGLAIVEKWFGDATRKVPMEFVDEVMEPRGLVAQVWLKAATPTVFGPGPCPTEMCRWDDRLAMPKLGQPGQEWVYLPDKALLRK
ncbi:hypothetical protein QJQ45_021357 [Haematococcus lacustris]|nr:hypothetical protein QJQ45_021357 [Haematococcus lacustris]